MLHACRTNNKVRPRRTLPTFFSQRYATGSSSGTLNRHTGCGARALVAARPRRATQPPRGAACVLCAGPASGETLPDRDPDRPARGHAGSDPKTHPRPRCIHGTAGLQSRGRGARAAGERGAHGREPLIYHPLLFLVSIYVIPLYGFKLRGAGAEAREAAPRRHRNKRRLRLPARARFWRVHVRSPLLHFRPMRPCTLVLRGSAGPGSVVAAGA